jgi:hypothetical protein
MLASARPEAFNARLGSAAANGAVQRLLITGVFGSARADDKFGCAEVGHLAARWASGRCYLYRFGVVALLFGSGAEALCRDNNAAPKCGI